MEILSLRQQLSDFENQIKQMTNILEEVKEQIKSWQNKVAIAKYTKEEAEPLELEQSKGLNGL